VPICSYEVCRPHDLYVLARSFQVSPGFGRTRENWPKGRGKASPPGSASGREGDERCLRKPSVTLMWRASEFL
jgi:hypothetical protein